MLEAQGRYQALFIISRLTFVYSMHTKMRKEDNEDEKKKREEAQKDDKEKEEKDPAPCKKTRHWF